MKKLLSCLYNKFVLLAPGVEVFVRSFYWHNVRWLKKFKWMSSSQISVPDRKIDFEKILDYLKEQGVCNGDIMIIHSSYDALCPTGLTPEKIIEELYALVGERGTLAMPAIRVFPEEGGDEAIVNYISSEYKDIVTLYDLYGSTVSSGILPYTLMRWDDAAISEFPLNPMVAIGQHAEDMMKNNVLGDLPTAHGPNSSWAYCADHDAWSIGIGIDIKNYLTIFHVAQEGDDWPVKSWFFERDFVIKRFRKTKSLQIRERRHLWTKYMAEANFYNDLIKNNILIVKEIEGVNVFMTRSRSLFDYIKNHKNTTYPYYLPKKYMR